MAGEVDVDPIPLDPATNILDDAFADTIDPDMAAHWDDPWVSRDGDTFLYMRTGGGNPITGIAGMLAAA